MGQTWEAAGHTTSVFRMQRDKHSPLHLIQYPDHGMVPLTVNLGLPTVINLA